MKVAYLKANQCWALLLGANLVSLAGKRLFETREEIAEYLRDVGLGLTDNNTVIDIRAGLLRTEV